MELSALEIDGLLSYWDQTMPEAEQARIAERLRTDADFRHAANETQLVVYAVRAAKSQQTRDYLSEFRRGLPPLSDAAHLQMPLETRTPQSTQSAVPGSFWRTRRTAVLALAAAFVGILVVWMSGVWPTGTSRGASLVGDYFESASGLTRKSGANDLEYRKALRLCAKGAYKEAIPIFKRQFLRERDTTLLLQIGVAAIGAGEIDEAVGSLEAAQKHRELKTQASWFLALALLEKQTDHDRAVQLLREVAAEESDYGQKAREKLQQMGDK